MVRTGPIVYLYPTPAAVNRRRGAPHRRRSHQGDPHGFHGVERTRERRATAAPSRRLAGGSLRRQDQASP